MESNPNHVVLPSFRYSERMRHLAGMAVVLPEQIFSLQRQHAAVWHEMLAAVRARYNAGELRHDDLLSMIDEMRHTYGEGYAQLWSRHMPEGVRAHQIRSEAARRRKFLINRPNGPAPDVWVGTVPECWDEPMPLQGEAVVYMLFDADGEPVYAGSSATFRTRLKTHLREKAGIVSWAAVLCADREDAYQREDELLKLRLPKYNRKASR